MVAQKPVAAEGAGPKQRIFDTALSVALWNCIESLRCINDGFSLSGDAVRIRTDQVLVGSRALTAKEKQLETAGLRSPHHLS